MRPTGKLTAAKVRALTRPGSYGDSGGLYLRVRDAGHRSWLFRYKRNGRARLMGLGPERDVLLSEAREAAAAARKLLLQGIDPLERRRAERIETATKARLNTFSEVAQAYIAAHQASWHNAKHRQQWRNTLDTYAVPVLGGMGVATIDTGAVMRVLEPIWRDKPETASRVRGRIESVLDYATARGWRAGDNPACWRGHLVNLLPPRAKIASVAHHAALPWREIGAFTAKLEKQPGTAALALRFTILTAARTGEVIGARWGEIDVESAVWTVPAERMKAGREHRVPLSAAVLDVLQKAAKLRVMRQSDPFIFPGGKPGQPLSNMAMLALLDRMRRSDLTAHGFRSTFRDWCAEATNYPREVAEAALAHTLKDKTEAAYQRGDLMEKRRRLMAEWATFCTRPASAGEVVRLRSAT
ncbi:MAG: integrase arm-type DNA-binding domain-containing protein [Pseudomonadota bacterium]|nr:integrase arm-type DNA-binding domain-containing protein [Pseudomonadota bacterium]